MAKDYVLTVEELKGLLKQKPFKTNSTKQLVRVEGTEEEQDYLFVPLHVFKAITRALDKNLEVLIGVSEEALTMYFEKSTSRYEETEGEEEFKLVTTHEFVYETTILNFYGGTMGYNYPQEDMVLDFSGQDQEE